MKKTTCGIILYHFYNKEPIFFLVHPGGPYKQAWGIPKGLMESGEDYFECACREFEEETSFKLTKDKDHSIIEFEEEYNPSNNKYYKMFAMYGFCSIDIKSNTCIISYHGEDMLIPEVDAAMWMTLKQAKEQCNVFQFRFVIKLYNQLMKGD